MRYPNFSYERKLWDGGCKLVAGVDEVGRGAWAGPLFAAAVIFPYGVRIKGINDSKKLSPEKRQGFTLLIKERALAWSIGSVEADFIERFGIVRATDEAMKRAIETLKSSPEFVLVDYFKLSFWPKEKQLPIKFGDSLSSSIAAASILAKVARDQFMIEQARNFPQYGFESHVGYGTKDHQAKIKMYGLSDIHRPSFIPEYLLNH